MNVVSGGGPPSGDPSIFPMQLVIGGVDFDESATLAQGNHLIAKLNFSVSETTNICVNGTFLFNGNGLMAVTAEKNGYEPAFIPSCCGVYSVTIRAFSPVDLHLLDPDLDSIGPNFNDTIPGATYDISTDKVYVPVPEPGDYKIKVFRDPNAPPGETTYTVTVQIDGGIQYVIAPSAPAPDGNQFNEIVITFDPTSPFCIAMTGDANASKDLSLSDVISTVRYVFGGGLSWISYQLCRGDTNGDGGVSLADVINLVNELFDRAPCNQLPPGGCILFNFGNGCCLPVSF